jgi:TRAP-type C4-dicarboxylate transport system substrate-binding protein
MCRTSLASVALITIAASAASAQTTTIRLATTAPTVSAYTKALADLGAEWEAKTSGRVKLIVYGNGQQGSEETTLRMMRPGVDQLQGNLLTLPGLSSIDDAFSVFGVPFLFASDAEANYVLEKLSPMLEKRLEAKGFKLLAWGSAGWVQVFSKQPIKTLADVKAAKLFTTQGDDRMVQWYKQNGFNPVALDSKDIKPQLTLGNGMINAAPMPPYPALILSIHQNATYMLDVRVAPLYGALVLSNQTWNKISAEDKAVLAATSKNIEKRLLGDAEKLDATSIATMKSRGLTVTTPDATALAAFRAEADRLVMTIRGTLIPADVYDAAVRERDAFRKTQK